MLRVYRFIFLLYVFNDGSYFFFEFFMYGIVDEKIDVYVYGVFLLEFIIGRLVLDNI